MGYERRGVAGKAYGSFTVQAVHKGGMSGVSYAPVPSVTVEEQKCPDAVLNTILKNIAPTGLEAVLVAQD